MLLQLLDDGRLTDGKGRHVNFRNTIVIMTSNLGSQDIAARPPTDDGDLDAETRARVAEALRAHFRPESATAPRGGGMMKAPRRGLRLTEC